MLAKGAPDDARSQGISSRDVDLVVLGNSGLGTRTLQVTFRWICINILTHWFGGKSFLFCIIPMFVICLQVHKFNPNKENQWNKMC